MISIHDPTEIWSKPSMPPNVGPYCLLCDLSPPTLISLLMRPSEKKQAQYEAGRDYLHSPYIFYLFEEN